MGWLFGRVVAEREPFFITLGGPKGHDFSGRKTFPREEPLNRRSVHFAPVRDDKGGGMALPEDRRGFYHLERGRLLVRPCGFGAKYAK
jgi:hypothetical protein